MIRGEVLCGGAERLRPCFDRAAHQVLEACFTRGRKTGRKSGPREGLCRKSDPHLEFPHLIHSRISGDHTAFRRLARAIAGDGRCAFLSEMRASGATRLFEFFSKQDNRRPRGPTISVSTRWVRNSKPYCSGKGKGNLHAAQFQAKLAATSDPHGQLASENFINSRRIKGL